MNVESHEPFLAAIRADRETDAPRLAYADWLEARGDGWCTWRAELIRVGCRIASLGESPEDAETRATLVDRHYELTRDDRGRLVGCTPRGLVVGTGFGFESWHRGFIDPDGYYQTEADFDASNPFLTARIARFALMFFDVGEDYFESLAVIAREDLTALPGRVRDYESVMESRGMPAPGSPGYRIIYGGD